LLTLTALSCAACVWVTGRNPASAFYLLPTRAWELGAGALLAVRQTRTGTRSASCRAGRHVENGMGLAGAALLATSLLCFNRGTAFPGGAALLPVAGAALLIVAPGSAVNRHLLSWRPLVFVGLVSYSWYLWHWPLLAFARLTDNRTLPTPTALALVALAFLLAVLSWWLIERPFRRSRGGAASTLWRYGAASMAMLALGAGGLYGAAWPQRLPPALAAIERSSAHAPDACLAPYGAAAPERSPLCSPTADQPALAILGDSHAAALTPALRTWAVRHRLALHAYTKSSCPALSGVTRWMPERPRHASECARYNEQVLQLVGASDAIRVVVLAGYWSAPYDDARQGQRYVRTGGAGGKVGPVTPADGDELADGLAATIRRLQLAGKKVVLVQDVPMFDFDPVRTVATAWIPARRTVATLLGLPASGPVFHAAARQVRNSADRSRTLINSIGGADARITVLDPWTSLCQDKQCFYGDGRQLYYTDAQHLNEAGAGLLLQTSDGAALLP
jgi:hypothetical protein